MVLGELLLSRFRLREAGFAGFLAAQVGLVGPDRMRFVTIFFLNHNNVKIYAFFALFMEGRSPINVKFVANFFF